MECLVSRKMERSEMSEARLDGLDYNLCKALPCLSNNGVLYQVTMPKSFDLQCMEIPDILLLFPILLL